MLSDLVQDLQLDFQGEDGNPIVSEEVATRMAERSLAVVSDDLAVAYRLEGETGQVAPDMPGHHREIWLLWAKVLICRFLRSRSANLISFSSGDKRIDRGKETTNWADLEKSLTEEYNSRIRRINPSADETILRLDTTPLIFIPGAAATWGDEQRLSSDGRHPHIYPETE